MNINEYDQSFIRVIEKSKGIKIFDIISQKGSKAQLRQDIFVLEQLNYKRNGFFVEFGAGDGETLSNTYYLDKEYGWTGILAEPAIINHDKIILKRPNAIIDTSCVYKRSDETVIFREVSNPELSTIDMYAESDMHSNERKEKKIYPVKTISLNDLLKKHGSPIDIDYISIDTEGSEFEILKAFDFSAYNVRIFTIEHNYTTQRKKIYDLMLRNGYQRKYDDLSDFDDWYVRNE